jgi:hypothetical protein
VRVAHHAFHFLEADRSDQLEIVKAIVERTIVLDFERDLIMSFLGL